AAGWSAGRQTPVEERLLRLPLEHLADAVVEALRLRGRVADRSEADAALLGESGHHVENDAGLRLLVEVEVVADRDVEEVGRRERAVERRLDVVAREVALLVAEGRREDGAVRVVEAVRQELEREERVCRAALPEVDLDRVKVPLRGAVAPHDDE